MSTPSQAQIDAALEVLVNKYLRHPQVSLIDYGLSGLGAGLETSTASRPSLRIHVRTKVRASDFPTEVHGIPVSLVRADYRLE